MQTALGLGLGMVPAATQHYDKVWDPVHHKWQKVRGRVPKEVPDEHVMDRRALEEKGLVLRKRSEVQSDEEIVETVRHRGEVLPRRPRRPGMDRQASSLDRGGGGGGRGGRSRRVVGGGGNFSDSEGSVPPRSRVRAKSTSGRSRRGRSSSSSSSSNLGSTTEEERECKKVARKKWITAALASVATIHAASKVYGSIESHDKRIEEVKAGKMSPEEAHKKQRSARWQDAAAIGIAALGIKGAMSEWSEVQEEHGHHKEMLAKHEEQHKKRLEHERRMRAKEHGGYYKGRDGNWYYDGVVPQSSQKYRGSDDSGGRGRAIDGPRDNERKVIEGPRDRSVYARDDSSYYSRDRSRARSTHGRDRSSDRRRVSSYDDRY